MLDDSFCSLKSLSFVAKKFLKKKKKKRIKKEWKSHMVREYLKVLWFDGWKFDS